MLRNLFGKSRGLKKKYLENLPQLPLTVCLFNKKMAVTLISTMPKLTIEKIKHKI